MRRPTTALSALAPALAALLLAGCASSADEPATQPLAEPTVTVTPRVAEPGEAHSHGEGIGDGSTDAAGGYRMVDLRVPRFSGSPGELSFRVLDAGGEPLRDYTEQQTKALHLYVVREDLQDFRHVHPVLGEDGTWRARVNLAGSGRYRAIAEFAPADGGVAEGEHVLLGATATVPGGWTPEPVTATSTGSDGALEVSTDAELAGGPEGRLELRLRDPESADGSDGSEGPAEGAPQLESYLGTSAHVTGFDVETGAVTHLHPLGEPETDGAETVLELHTDIEGRGQVLFFVQVRRAGFVHTVPVTTTVV